MDPGRAGPAWFIAVLLAFDLAAASIYGLVRAREAAVPPTEPPPRVFAMLSVASVAAFLPFLLVFGPTRWFAAGPFAIQASRVGLYATYFLAGVLSGRHGPNFVLKAASRMRRSLWAALTVLLFGVLVAEQAARLHGALALPRVEWLVVYGCSFVLFCAAANLMWFAVFSRLGPGHAGARESFVACAYGIYLLHYPFVIWIQFALLDVPLAAIVKASLVFSLAIGLSWSATALLRRVPPIARVI